MTVVCTKINLGWKGLRPRCIGPRGVHTPFIILFYSIHVWALVECTSRGWPTDRGPGFCSPRFLPGTGTSAEVCRRMKLWFDGLYKFNFGLWWHTQRLPRRENFLGQWLSPFVVWIYTSPLLLFIVLWYSLIYPRLLRTVRGQEGIVSLYLVYVFVARERCAKSSYVRYEIVCVGGAGLAQTLCDCGRQSWYTRRSIVFLRKLLLYCKHGRK